MPYLDYQATTPLAPEARAAMLEWLADADDPAMRYANPASPYRAGRAAAVAVEQARDAVAALLPLGGRVIFTSGATEALNWALRGVATGGVAVSAIEHAAVLQPASTLGAKVLPVAADGVVEPFLPRPDEMTAVMLVNNEIGTIQPIHAIAEKVQEEGGILLCDAVQAFGRLPIPPGPDLIAISAHKIHGPKGIGALWVRDGIELSPLMVGGGQEGGLRAGTLAPALIAGFGAAARVAAERMEADRGHVERLMALALDLLFGWRVNGSLEHRWPGNLNARREGVNATRLLSDCRQVAFSLGSACGSGSGRSSHVLRAIGLSQDEARSSIRLGWGRYTTEAQLREGIGAIVDAANRQGL